MRIAPLAVLLVALSAWPALGQGEGPLPPPTGTIEILDRDACGQPLLARVALQHQLPGFVEDAMQLGGTWSYLIRDGAGVAVFDVGPRFPLAWSVLPWPSWKLVLPKLHGNDVILKAADEVFPGKPLTQVVMSHWHPDHTEDAPALQRAAAEKWGQWPPLRMMAPDRPARWRGWLPVGAESVFLAAGFRGSEWRWGEDLTDGGPIGRTGYQVLSIPGHTAGNIALVNHDRRVSLGPTPTVEPPRAGWLAENLDVYKASALKFYQATFGYRHHCTHPGKELTDAGPGSPEAHKRGHVH